jgi:hypothetical protein
MISARSASALIGIASCVASFLAGIAYADGFARVPERDPAVSVVACIDDDIAIDTRPASFSGSVSLE